MSPTGHLAIGFATRKYAPRIPLLAFLVAAYAIDLLYFAFLALGIETVDYWSHSLLMAATWSVVGMLITLLITRRFRSSLVIGLVVLSHWVLDFMVWNNILIGFDKTTRVGLGLYNAIGFSQSFSTIDASTVIASCIELSLLGIGIIEYLRYRKRSGTATM